MRYRSAAAILAAAMVCALVTAVATGAPGGSPLLTEGRIAFLALSGPDASLYVVSPTGAGLHRLTAAGAVTLSGLSWSPDGRSLAYVCDDFQLCTIRADGTHRRVLTKSTWPSAWSFVAGAAWSPDGSKIAFTYVVAGRGHASSIETIDVATGARKVVVKAAGSELVAPSWSPDGTKLCFGGASQQVVEVAADGPARAAPFTRVSPPTGRPAGGSRSRRTTVAS